MNNKWEGDGKVKLFVVEERDTKTFIEDSQVVALPQPELKDSVGNNKWEGDKFRIHL